MIELWILEDHRLQKNFRRCALNFLLYFKWLANEFIEVINQYTKIDRMFAENNIPQWYVHMQ